MKHLYGMPFLVVSVFLGSFLYADSSLEHKTFLGKEPAKVWTSGLKQRKEFNAPFIGKQVVITRVDKGVEWTLNTKKKTYTEQPLALPYTPSKASSPKSPAGKRETGTDQDRCTPEIKKLPAGRTIAGLSASGTWMGCKESSQDGMILWQAAPTSVTQKLQQELKTFDAALAKARFANYPPKERREMEGGLSMWSRLLGEIPLAMTGQTVSDDFLVAMEAESSESSKQTFYEVTAISAAAVPASNFEIPPGFTKVAKSSPFGGMGDMNLGDMMKGLQNLKPE